MAIHSVMQTGLQGMQHSQREMQRSAHQIAQLNTDAPETAKLDAAQSAANKTSGETASKSDTSPDVTDVAEPLVDMLQQQQMFDASAKVVKVGGELLGSLLDTSV